jgi:DNA-binding ferritin-like protein
MIDKLIERGFKLRNTAHLAHWSATGAGSFARHEALGEFYEELITQLDKYVEAYQGAFGVAVKEPAEDATESMRKDMLWITEHRGEIARGVPALENILDELVALHLRTLYKLENLR